LVIEICQGDDHMPNSTPSTTGGAGGSSANSQTLAAMQSAATQMQQVLQETTTFNALKQSLGAGTTAAQSVGQQTPGG
jgi:hypothetical protein